jgi:NAD(P)H-quinone oxidoreductase subunit 2
VGLVTTVISIYYYIRVVKMMVVKEPQEMSDVVKNYPEIRWNLPGMRPLQVGIVLSLIATSLAGILSNPLFTIANDSVINSPMLQSMATTPVQVKPAVTSAIPAISSTAIAQPIDSQT